MSDGPPPRFRLSLLGSFALSGPNGLVDLSEANESTAAALIKEHASPTSPHSPVPFMPKLYYRIILIVLTVACNRLHVTNGAPPSLSSTPGYYCLEKKNAIQNEAEPTA